MVMTLYGRKSYFVYKDEALEISHTSEHLGNVSTKGSLVLAFLINSTRLIKPLQIIQYVDPK